MTKKTPWLTMRNERDGRPKRIPPELLDEILARCGNFVQRFIQRRMRGARQYNIEDVSQETYLRLLRLLPGEPIQDLNAFMLAVADNVIRDFAMKDSRDRMRMSFDSDEAERLFERVVDDPQNEAETDQELAQITKHLPQHLLATLLLCERDGLTYEEAAKKLGKSPHTIKKWLADAKARCLVRANGHRRREGT